MRKRSLWLMMPLLALSVQFGFSSQDKGKAAVQKAEILNAMPREDLNAMQSYREKQASAEQLKNRLRRMQRSRPKVVHRESLSRFDISGGHLGLKPVNDSWSFRKASGAQITGITANGADSTGIGPGDPVTLVITFSAGMTDGIAELWADMDGDTEFDPNVDFDLDNGGSFADNDFEDEDPTVGVFQITLGDQDVEGAFHVTGITIFVVVDDGVSEGVAEISVNETETAYSISGTVTPAAANVIIMAFPKSIFDMPMPDGTGDNFFDYIPSMTVTNTSGNYTIFLSAADTVDVFAMDFLGVQPGLVADTVYKDKAVPSGGVSGLDFNFITPTTFVEGYVKDEFGTGVDSILVFAFGEFGLEFEDTTDASGYYNIGLMPGHYYVEVDDEVIPEYMVPMGTSADAIQLQTVSAPDITIYAATSTIAGTVTVDGMPFAGGMEINAWGYPTGYTYTMSDPTTGAFTLNVSPSVDQQNYSVWPNRQPAGTFIEGQLWNIPPDTPDLAINFVTAAGGIVGAIVDNSVSPPDSFAFEFIDAEDVDNFFGYGGESDDQGNYDLPLPDGRYVLHTYVEGYLPYMSDTITVAGADVPWDIELVPLVAEGAIEGNVSALAGGFSLVGAELFIWNNDLFYGDMTFTDDFGDYHFDVPNGFYEVWVFMPGYFDAYDTATVAMDTVDVSFLLDAITVMPPNITSIVDVSNLNLGNDQGRQVLITFDAGADSVGSFFGWNILHVPGPNFSPDEIIYLGFILTRGASSYTVLAPTFVDSNTTTGTAGTNSFESWYVISGYGDGDDSGGPGFVDSAPMSGWSVDNLLPGVPANLALAPITDGFTLSWEPVPDADLQYYVVKLGDLKTSTESLLAIADNTITLTSADITLGNEYDFSVAAVDNNGNYSAYSPAINSVTLDLVDGAALPTAYALDANYPNPFNPSTNIQFALPEAGALSLTIYDLTGRVIQTLANGRMPAGYHQVVWDGRNARGASVATGVYFYRIVTSGGFTATRKMILMK